MDFDRLWKALLQGANILEAIWDLSDMYPTQFDWVGFAIKQANLYIFFLFLFSLNSFVTYFLNYSLCALPCSWDPATNFKTMPESAFYNFFPISNFPLNLPDFYFIAMY